MEKTKAVQESKPNTRFRSHVKAGPDGQERPTLLSAPIITTQASGDEKGSGPKGP